MQEPTPEELARRIAEVRSSWSEEDRLSRGTLKLDRVAGERRRRATERRQQYLKNRKRRKPK